MDLIDKGILTDLEENCRLSYQTLSNRYGVSANAIKKRIDNLIEEGVIERFDVVLSYAMIDADYVVAIAQTDGTLFDDKTFDGLGENPMISVVLPLASGDIMVDGDCVGTDGIGELGNLLRVQPGVADVEIHPILINRGKKKDLTNLDLKVLKMLVKNPRSPISEIARQTGLTSKRVRGIINRLVDGEVIRFTIWRNINTGQSVVFSLKVSWNENITGYEEIIDRLRKSYPLEFWYPSVSAIHPTMFCVFVVEHIRDIEEVMRRVHSFRGVVSVRSMLFFTERIYDSLRSARLKELIGGV
ncbi:MAG: Lrp/AsnC family transcriptional regulator [Candidatus Thorarchaeota archaeon]|nr:MAG: Lrp/AsnC family transcriptional regulator [Candidatus Thorarchaeota archaeon]